jgi:aminoglycoside phosphotransferase (APT) family kinase protein
MVPAMPVPKARDPEETRARLQAWLAGRLPDATGVAVTALEMPRSNGFSSETLMFDASWTLEGRTEQRRLVARVKPTGYSIFHEYDLERQRRVIETLGRHTEVPVPEVLWHTDDDNDDDALGQPFFVMERVDGRTPPDSPPYAAKGWLLESSAEEQLAVWRNGLAEVAKIHAVDWKGLGLDFLDRSGEGAPGLAPEIAYNEHYLGWMADGRSFPLLDDALAWLKANVPSTERVCLNWGDARFGNMLYRGTTPVAVLDWEMVALGPPETDLAWWLVFHRCWTEAQGLPNLPGFPDHDSTIALYEQLAGRSTEPMHWYEVWAGFRLGVIFQRLTDMFVRTGLLPAGTEKGPHVPIMRTLRALLDEA